MNERDIQAFWNAHSCGDRLVGGAEHFADYERFFQVYDNYRYSKEAHIHECLDEVDFCGKDTLEIGLGQGADAEQLVRRGARWSGIDLTRESTARVLTRFKVRRIPYVWLVQGSVLELPFDDNSFDVIFSHGVLHHVPDIGRAQEEIHRVLRPGGLLVVMLYAKWSINYLISIGIVRRLGLAALLALRSKRDGLYQQHMNNARSQGVKYFRLRNFIHKNTDGPLNPYSKVYDRRLVETDFSMFHVRRAFKRFMHAPPLQLDWPALEQYFGWHLWVHMAPKQ